MNFVRFYWKQASGVAGTDAGKAKILRNVAFPKVFDIFEFCSAQLKESLLQGRTLETENRAKEDAVILEGKQEEAKNADVEMQDEEETKEERQ